MRKRKKRERTPLPHPSTPLPPYTLHDPYTTCPTMLSGLATSPNHSTTECLHSLWSQSTPISLGYELCFHTVSVHHLLVQHCRLKAEMTEHGGGRGGWLSGVLCRRSLHVWLVKGNTSAPILKQSLFTSLASYFPFLFIVKFEVRQGGKGEKHACEWARLRERETWRVFVGSVQIGT